MKSAGSLLDFGDYGDEYGDQLICFVDERLQLVGRYDLCFGQQLQPVGCFVQFLQAALDLADKIGVRFGTLGLTIVRTSRSAGTQYLFADDLCLRRLGQTGVQPNYPQRKTLRPLLQILIRRHFSSFRLPPLSFLPYPSSLQFSAVRQEAPQAGVRAGVVHLAGQRVG